MLSAQNLDMLRRRGLLDEDNRPTKQAYEIAVQTISQSGLCDEMFDLMYEDTVCNKRGTEAINAK